jgi:hypothetical protein
MNIKTGILAAAAVLALAVPAAALAQPYDGGGYHHGYGYAPDWRRDDWRRVAWERDVRRAEEFRRIQWARDHYRPYGDYGR